MTVQAPGTAPASGALEALDHELKYVLAAAREAEALSYLRAVCFPDSAHPHNTICSLYYDTPGLQLLSDKINSDYLKLKVRLRWYEDDPTSPLFIEAKYRIGSRREKVRVALPHDAAWLSARTLDNDDVVSLPQILRAHGVGVNPALRPMFVVRYDRHRFMEPISGGRVSFDRAIGVPAVSAGLGGNPPLGRLNHAVIEIKAPDDQLPISLTRIDRLGCRRMSFSKYLACYQLVTRTWF